MTPDTFGKNLIRRAFKPNPPMKLIISDDDNGCPLGFANVNCIGNKESLEACRSGERYPVDLGEVSPSGLNGISSNARPFPCE